MYALKIVYGKKGVEKNTKVISLGREFNLREVYGENIINDAVAEVFGEQIGEKEPTRHTILKHMDAYIIGADGKTIEVVNRYGWYECKVTGMNMHLHILPNGDGL